MCTRRARRPGGSHCRLPHAGRGCPGTHSPAHAGRGGGAMTTQSRTLDTGQTAEELDRLTGVTTEPSFRAQCFEKGDAWHVGNRWVTLPTAARLPCQPPGLLRRIDTPVRTRAYRGRCLRVECPAAEGATPGP